MRTRRQQYRLSYQFPYINIRWVEELSRILTPILFDHWLTYRLREISRIAMATKAGSEETKYERVLDHIRKLLVASSARLFLQRQTQTTEFVEKAHAGQAWAEGVAAAFDLEDSKSESAKTINAGKRWSTGVIGTHNFVERGDQKGPLEEGGHRGCAIIPIYNGEGNCFAALMVTSTDNVFEMSMWDSTVETISKNLNVVLEAIHLQETRVEARQSYFAHTIKTRANRVSSGGARLINLLQPLLGPENLTSHVYHFANEVEALQSLAGRHGGRPLTPESVEILNALRRTFPSPTAQDSRRNNELGQILADLQEHLGEIKKSVIFIAGGANQEDPHEADPELWDGTWADLRLCLLQSLKPLQSNEAQKTNIRVPDRSVLPVGIKTRIPQHLLIEIINNIVDNAIKYDFSPPSSTLRIAADLARKRYVLDFRNLAPSVSRDEARRFKDFNGFRSLYARDKNKDGSGVGLRFIRDLSVAWKFDFEYAPPTELAAPGSAYGWHSLKLGFHIATNY